MELSRELTTLAACRYGLVTAAELAAHGFAQKWRRRAELRGQLRLVAPGVWAIGGTPDMWEQRLLGVVLSLGPAARASHRSAAALLRFEGFPRGPIEVIVPRSSRVNQARLPAGVMVRTATSIPLIDCCTIDGIPTTTAARTILDLAQIGTERRRLAVAIDHSVRDRRLSPAFLAKRLAERRGPGHPGSVVITELLRDAGGHSILEREFLALLRAAGVPRPQTQRVVPAADDQSPRVDFSFAVDMIVEVTGRVGHSSPTERERDAERRNALTARGIRVYEYTWEQVTGRPEWVVETLRRRLAGE